MLISLLWKNSTRRVTYKVIDWDAKWFTLKDMFGAILKVEAHRMKNLNAKFL